MACDIRRYERINHAVGLVIGNLRNDANQQRDPQVSIPMSRPNPPNGTAHGAVTDRLSPTTFRSPAFVRTRPSLKRDLSYTDVLCEVIGLEIRYKHEKHFAMRASMARFPCQESLSFSATC